MKTPEEHPWMREYEVQEAKAPELVNTLVFEDAFNECLY